ncbi:vWA domain-containing protein [Glycomyces tarimensis]
MPANAKDDETSAADDPEPNRRRRTPALLITFSSAALTILANIVNYLGILAEGRTRSELETFHWLAFGLSFLAAVSGGVLVFGIWLNREHHAKAPGEETKPRRWLRPTVIATTAVGILALVVALFQPQIRNIFDPPCGDPIELTVAVPQEGAAGFAEAVEAFASDQRGDHDCRSVDATALPVSWAQAQQAFEDDWGAATMRELGARPDVWIAESAAQIESAKALTGGGRSPLTGERVPIGSTPLVLAVPEAHQDLGATAEDVFTSLAAPEGPSVVRADPELSFAALYHLQWLYGLDMSPSAAERSIADGLESHGVGKLDETELLCLLHNGDASATGVLTTERAMAVYNNGDMGADCPQTDRPETPLRAMYPAGAASLDYTAVDLGWPDPEGADDAVEADRDRASADLIGWLTEPAGAAALAEIGVRTEGRATLLAADPGVDITATPSTYLPQASRIAELEAAFGDARMPARVLLAVDNSGSMDEASGTGDQTLADLARAGAEEALGAFGRADEFGLWVFPDGERLEPVELVPIGPADPEHHRQAVELLEARAPEGDTPLYHTIASGVSALEGLDDGAAQSVMVVLTDGENDDAVHRIGLDELTEQVTATDVQLYVITVAGASCESTGLGELATASRGRCESVQARSIESAFAEVFDQIWGGND